MELYYYPGNASLAPHIILRELGLDYKLILVDRKEQAQKSKEYLALNPVGRIPTLVDDNRAIFESAAICIHISEKCPNSTLIPPIGNKDRSSFFQWLMYLTNTFQAELMVYHYPEKHTTDQKSVKAIEQAQESRLGDMLQLLDKELSNREFLVGTTPTICDFYLLMLCRWATSFAKPPLEYEHLGPYLRRLVKRKAVRETLEKEGLSFEQYL
mmetsp:Transcript_7768/g.12547  ORF Transcript_7768/g.12547 Transcript_7768/m.12547 type:complete len:212 (+) Transcript_7768:71-706(+)|eukprot:CAMPEP_0203750690 /NCGR_PEP_ID=MMETSP0098-20131031/4890_1 /ASSEMBLY_ACC=CAM_ASM_000208 /TAXON_ID=96639 /ORGANISM=" , Strain NY0313808BC1" /LENGTH=211 /DNA_ID=CAMNT_0050640099 /DNA_START=139 /DNA_END=774 /DNA_ORIENTATION=-